MSLREIQGAVNKALGEYLQEGEIAVAWIVTIEVAGPDGKRYLAHRSGGGHDGSDQPTAWAALGMQESGVELVRDQLRGMTEDASEDE